MPTRYSRAFRVISLLITICLFNFPAHAKYSGGTGEPNDPYKIATAEDLMTLGETPDDYDKHFILTADIDLDPNLPGCRVFSRALIAPDTSDAEPWFEGTRFIGVFDGKGHTIWHLTVSGESYLGLFGLLASPAMISNLGLRAVDVRGTGECIGGLVGRNHRNKDHSGRYTSAVLTNCYSMGTVRGGRCVGGLAGRNEGSITTSYAAGMVGGDAYIGGLVGVNIGTVAASYSRGTVCGGRHVGGLVGDNARRQRGSTHGTITASYSTSAVSGDEYVGGLVGLAGEEDVTRCFWDTQNSTQLSSAGGTGLGTAEMQTAASFLNAGWDFVAETANGTDDIWRILEGQDYPRLWWEERRN